MRETITTTQRTQSAIFTDILSVCADLRICWKTGNGLSAAVAGRLDELWEELRAAKVRDRYGTPSPEAMRIYGNAQRAAWAQSRLAHRVWHNGQKADAGGSV